MKKWVLAALSLFCMAIGQALPFGNPSEPSLFCQDLFFCLFKCEDPCDSCWLNAVSLRGGFYGDYVFNRHLRVKGETQILQSAINTSKLTTNAGYLALNAFNRFDVFSTIGASQLFLRTQGADEIWFETNFSWSIGARAILCEWRCFTLGVEGQYFHTNPRPFLELNNSNGAFDNLDGINNLHYHEWQAGIGVSYRIATTCPSVALIPYVGGKWSYAKLNFQQTVLPLLGFIDDIRSNKKWGYAIGVTFTLCDVAGVTVEGRWVDEKAVYVNGQFRF